MSGGVEWVEPARRDEEARAPPEVEDQVRELRDQVRRLQEQVTALAARPKETARVRTFVDGLDGILEGGVPRGHVVLLAGPTGAMKTSLALYMMARNRAAGVHGVYVTVEESRESIVETMRRLRLGAGEDFLVDIGRLRLEHAGAEEVRDWIVVLRDYLTRRHEREALGLVVIDSLNALTALASGSDVRGSLFQFFSFLRSLGVTALLVTETDPDRPGYDHEVDFLADGIFELRFSGAGRGKVQLLFRCAKMRHTDHPRDYFVMAYEKGGFVLRPYQEPKRRWGRRA